MGPLAGKKIIEIAGLGPGPVCGMLLADMGAEVMLVERRSGTKPSALEAANATIMNRGKQSIALDLKQESGRDVVLRLLAQADGLIEGFRPGVMERLGLGPDECLAANPGLIYGRMTGWGQVVDAAMADGSALSTTLLYALFKSGQWTPDRGDNFLDGGAYWYDTYECADGKFVSIGAIEPNFHELLLQKLGLQDDPAFARQYDKQGWPALKTRFAEIFRSRRRDEWCELLEGTDVCFAPVLDFDEAPRHPHNVARGTFTEVAGVTQPAPAPRFGETESCVAAPPPRAGQHTESILLAAGYSADELAALRASGAI